jgi:hypothetical protein
MRALAVSCIIAPVDPKWIRHVIADCRHLGVALFHKQWGTYKNNPLVIEHGMAVGQAKELDQFGKGGGLVDGVLVREFPDSQKSAGRRAA